MALTYTKVAAPRRGVIVAYTVKNGIPTIGTVEQYVERTYRRLGGRVIVDRKKVWRATRANGRRVGIALWTREQAARRL